MTWRVKRESNDPWKEPTIRIENYNTDGKEAHYGQINQMIRAVPEGKKISEEIFKKAEMDLMLG